MSDGLTRRRESIVYGTMTSSRWMRSAFITLSMQVGLTLLCSPVAAQELEPRAYSPSPTGANFVILAGGRSTGAIVSDPSTPITDINAEVNSASIGYGRTFGLFGRSASAGIFQPYIWATVSGKVFEEARTADRAGVGDTRLRLGMNILGGPALTPAEFAKQRPGRTLGASVLVVVPTGQYYPDRLINLGTNRWAFKPEVGFSQPVRRWFFDAYVGAWLFTDNDEFYGGQLREQEALGTFQGHVSYTFKPRMWLAGDATYYTGGRTTLNGTKNADLQANSRFGVTFSAPVGRRNSIKLSATTGATTRVGGSFDTIALAWQFLWFD